MRVVATLSIVALGAIPTVVGAITLIDDLGALDPLDRPEGLRVRFPGTVGDATGGRDWPISIDVLDAVDVFGAVDAISVVVAFVALGLLATCWTATIVAVHLVVRTVARRR